MTRTRTPRRTGPVGSVALVGAGPGDAGLLTRRGADLLAQADLVLADHTLDADLLAGRRDSAEVLTLFGPSGIDSPAEAAAVAVARVKEGCRVVVLVNGDPFVFGHGSVYAEAFAKAKVSWQAVPGVSSAVAVPAYAGVPITADGVTQDVALVSAFEDPDSESSRVDWAALAAGPRTLVLLSGVHTLGKVAAKLVEHGRRGDTPVSVTTGGTLASQRTIVSRLDAVETEVAGLVDPAVVVIGDVVKLRSKLSWFETRPLFGWTVLVPRTRAQAGETSTQLRGLGATPVEVPTIAVEPPRTPAPMDRAIKGLVSGRYMWVAFTSTNAVKAVREKLEEVGLDARAFAGIRVAAVGEATAGALAAFGIRPDLVPSGEQSSEGLLEDWAPYDDLLDPIDRVFLPRADIATETLVAGLKELGWAVDDVTAYRTVRAAPPPAATREAIKGGGFDAVLFTSSSTVRNLVGIAGKPHERTVIAAIGPQTAATAREFGLRVDVQPETASSEALIEALAAFAVQRRKEAPAPVEESKARRAPRRPAGA